MTLHKQSETERHVEKLPDSIGTREFIVLIAALTSIIALAIDSMLPALPAISADFALTNPNDRQLVITAFVLSFGPAQLIFGPLSDSIGRRRVLMAGVIVFSLASLAAVFATSFEQLLLARIVQGISAAAVRVSSNAIVRDCFSGRAMARIMSYVFTVFILVPIAAPALGQAVLWVADWHFIFLTLCIATAALSVWYWLRLEETLPPARRQKASVATLWMAVKEILTNRIALGYTFAVTLFFGGLFSFVVSIQQIIEVVYGMQDWFAAIFAITSTFIGAASLTNANLVRTYGMRRISHLALLCFTVFGGVLLTISFFTTPPLWLAILLIGLIMGCFGFIAGNFNALAMEPLGHIAGAASSVLGTISFTGGALLGAMVGQMFDGTLVPLASAYTGFGIIGLGIVLITERGRLFQPGD